MTKLAQALHAFQADAPPIHLDATNPHFRNRYASLGGVVAAIRPALNKHGLVYTQLPTHLDGTPALRTVLMHAESGEQIEDTMPLILSKQDSQAQGSALTYGRRYALLSILGLVGDEDDDANSATNGAAAKPAVSHSAQAQVPARDPDPHGLQSARADAPFTPPAKALTQEGQDVRNRDAAGRVKKLFGAKYKGRTIAEIADMEGGQGHLQWLASDAFEPKQDAQKHFKQAVCVWLGVEQPEIGSEFSDIDVPF